MKVFISSVRRGLEDERDALPGLIRALGFEPIRFEDFTAQPVPSREACLSGVEAADVYLLLLGPIYGDPMPGAGVSPTEEELTVARRRGIPIIAFVKNNVIRETQQEDFVGRIEDYGTGFSRNSFTSAVDLQPAVASALREIHARPPALAFVPVDATTLRPVRWMTIEGDRPGGWRGSYQTTLEVHGQPLDAPRLTATDLADTVTRLARVARELGLFGITDGLEVDTGVTHVRVDTTTPRDRRSAENAGIQISRERDVGVFFELRGDMLGTILDSADVTSKVAAALKAISAAIGTCDGLVAFTVALQMTRSTVEGTLADLGRRSSASMDMSSDPVIVVSPDDAVPAGAIYGSANEIGAELTARLLQLFRHRRRM